ncbi:MAG: T9SS type A sorting domain-containing protein [Ignavibacteria bacterium]|nr:T9SS type A sorting domain-containing protein [Ignavibacteria bacterium]
MSYHGVYDIFTIENWTMSRGIRKYHPFCDIHSEVLENYCSDSLDLMKFKATFTNDCWLYITASRKNIAGNWESINIKELNDSPVNSAFAIKWQYAGWNQASSDLFIDLQLDLPVEDYVLGDSVALTVRIYPEYSNPTFYYNNEHIEKTYKSYITKSCLPRSGGCPFIYVKNNNDDYEADNNILHRMEFSEPSVNITDKYKLRTEPKIENGAMELYLVENENDLAFIDQFKLYAVDYPVDKKMGITEDNKIVIYDSVSVIASDSVMLNAANITSNVNYFNPGVSLTNGYKTDSLYAHFSYPDGDKKLKRTKNKKQNSTVPERSKSKESFMSVPDVNLPLGFITNLRNLQYPIAGTKDTAGYLTATSIYSNTVSKIFARRELESVVILPLFNDTDLVDHLNIQWQSDFRMKYLGMATLDYTNYVVNEAMLKEGLLIDTLQQSNVTSNLVEIDGNYGEFNASSLIKMSFELSGLPALPEDYKREYVIEVTGNYINGGNMQDSKKSIQELPLVFRLSQNYPNPFNPITKINYELPKNSVVKIVIYDILGREVTKLVNNELKQAGRYSVEFDGKNYASGVYFYRIEAGSFVQAKKMVLLK